MNKACFLFLALLLTLFSFPLPALAAQRPDAVSTTAVVIDADTGQVLYGKNKNKKMYPASITKVMTGLLVSELCKPTGTFTVKASDVRLPSGYAHISLSAGDTLTVNDAMYAMLLPSANDAANALASYAGSGSRSTFVSMMNGRAKVLGAQNTNFTNPTGIPDKNHYTTAYDMAVITQAAIKNDMFMEYFSATSWTFPAVKRKRRETLITTYQYMLLEDKDEYNPDVIAGKIGYTGQAGHTMVTVARRGNRTLICVVMGSTRNGKYDDTTELLDYCFSKYGL